MVSTVRDHQSNDGMVPMNLELLDTHIYRAATEAKTLMRMTALTILMVSTLMKIKLVKWRVGCEKEGC